LARSVSSPPQNSAIIGLMTIVAVFLVGIGIAIFCLNQSKPIQITSYISRLAKHAMIRGCRNTKGRDARFTCRSARR
jgi:hypothetical protein